MDFTERIDVLEQRVLATRSAVKASATESREQLRQRVDQAHADTHQAIRNAQHRADQTTAEVRSKWAQMRADLSAKVEDVKARIDQRNRESDARAAANDADWTETNAADALDFAEWAIVNAELAVLDSIDSRAHADALAREAHPEAGLTRPE